MKWVDFWVFYRNSLHLSVRLHIQTSLLIFEKPYCYAAFITSLYIYTRKIQIKYSVSVMLYVFPRFPGKGQCQLKICKLTKEYFHLDFSIRKRIYLGILLEIELNEDEVHCFSSIFSSAQPDPVLGNVALRYHLSQ